MSQDKLHYNKKNQSLKSIPKDCFSNASALLSVDLSNNEITSIPKEISAFKSLTHFRVMANRLTCLPNNIVTLTCLRHLDLNANQFTSFPVQISNLTTLEELQMIQNQLTEIPDCIGNLTNLQRISFTANNLKALPKSLSKCTNINFVELTSNEFDVFPDVICDLTKVTILMMQQNNLKEIPMSIKRLEKLSGLLLSSNQFSTFPESVCEVTSLTQIELDNNNFVEIPNSLSKLVKLKALVLNKSFISCLNSVDMMSNLCQVVLSDTKCMFLPDLSTNAKLTSLNVIHGCLSELKSLPPSCSCRFTGNVIEDVEFPDNGTLQYMILANNKLKTSPDLSMLSKISRLDISQNCITWFDEKTCHPTLQQLDVSCNPLVEFPVCLSKCVSLKSLNVSDCHLFDVPAAALSTLTNLETLFLACNHLSSLESLSVMTKLKALYLQSNNLLHFPRSVFALASLKTLFMSNNQITVIPDQITQLTNLEQIDLCCNAIQSFDSLTKVPSLKEIDVSFNFIKALPVDIENLKNLCALNVFGNELSYKAKLPHLEKTVDFFQVQQVVLKNPKDEPDTNSTVC
ncbi:podocan precursor, putative, partial [Entamoeba invadens IP1]